MKHCDFLVVGGGIIGLCISARLKEAFGGSRVILLEKEPALGKHASGRNSGVLHAGFYYSTDSLKARFTREGNRALTRFCHENGLRVNECGKLVVAQNERDIETLDRLFEQGKLNGVELVKVSSSEARSIEPRAKTAGAALFSPTTSSVDPQQVVSALSRNVEALGVEVHLGETFVRRNGDRIQTTHTCYEAPYVVNAAGLYADTIARQFGFSKKHRILPFMGLYLYSNQPPGSFRTHIYPAPDIRYPFLGIHFTQTVDGRTKIGPTAIPAFWREQYSLTANFNLKEFLEILARQTSLFFSSGWDFKNLALREMKRYSKKRLVREASALASQIQEGDFRVWGKPGIRAQLIDIESKRLEMDFVVEGDDRSFHILNAVSPAFTCSFPFSDFVCEKIRNLINP